MPTQIGGRTWSNTDLILGGGLVVALINWFIPWWYTSSASCSGCGLGNYNVSAGISGFGLWSGILGFIVLLALIALFAVRVFAPNVLPPLPVADWMLYAGGGVFLVLMAVIFLTYAAGTGGSVSGAGYSYSSGISIGFFLGLLTGVVVAVGGYMRKSEPQPATQPFNLSSMGQNPPPPSYGPPPPPPTG